MNAPFKPAKGVLTHKLQNHHCRWIVAERPHRFCGEPKAVRSYCEFHARIVYSRPPEGDRAKPL